MALSHIANVPLEGGEVRNKAGRGRWRREEKRRERFIFFPPFLACTYAATNKTIRNCRTNMLILA